MHHLYPLAKGDPLCPLGFHPQVRWPTRCKRCFRDYKEHGGRKKDEDLTVSSPSLASWNSASSRSRDGERSPSKEPGVRGWVSSQNLNQDSHAKTDKTEPFNAGFARTSSSWTSTPDLGGISDDTKAVTFSLTLPKKRPTPVDTGQHTVHATLTELPSVVTLRRPGGTPPPTPSHLIINKSDSLAERVRKMQAMKAHSNSFDKESSVERQPDANKKEKPRETTSSSTSTESVKLPPPKSSVKPVKPSDNSKANDVNFLIKVKSAPRPAGSRPPLRGGPLKDLVNGGSSRDSHSDRDDSDSNLEDDNISTSGTSTTETTLIDHNHFDHQQMESLREEVESLRKRCERVEKEKSDILLRRLASLDTSSSKTNSRPSEMLKLQQKINELTVQNEDLRDEKKHLQVRIREFESDVESRPTPESVARTAEQLRSKLLAAETLCEELMDENEDMKRELRSMEEEIEEMQDNFREDQADEYSSLRKELEQTTKNCRVLSFKLKKTERKAEQLEQEKKDHEKKLLELAGGAAGLDRVAKIKQMELDMALSNEVALRLQKELQEANAKLNQLAGPNAKKAPTLANVGKSQSTDARPSRATLTRGGSQEDPQKLLRDLQDSLEREADLREQLKNAEEEGVNLRKKGSRLEDDNESLVLQLKKMATKARSRKLSPTPPANRLTIENVVEKDEGISDEEDPAELRILLELNEQEASVLRRKVEELEHEGESLKTQLKEMADKLTAANLKAPAPVKKTIFGSNKAPNLSEEKIKILEDEIADVRKKLIEKERDCERLHAELSLTQKRSKASLVKSKSLDGANEQQNVDLKRQLQLIEQEASVLTTKNQTLEADNEKLQAENKKNQLLRGTKTLKTEKSIELNTEKITQLEAELQEAHSKIKELEIANKDADKPVEKKVTFGAATSKKDAEALKAKQDELDKLKLTMKKVETEKDKLADLIRLLKDEAIKSFRPRTPKKPTDFTTKLQLKKMVEDLESEIGEMFVVMKNADMQTLGKKQQEVESLEKTVQELRNSLNKNDNEMKSEKLKLQAEINKLNDVNSKYEKEKKSLSDQLINCEKERDQVKEDYRRVQENSKKLDEMIDKLNNDLKSANSKNTEYTTSKNTDLAELKKKIEELKMDLLKKDKEVLKLKKDLETAAEHEEAKNKLMREAGDKAKKILELENKLKESEDKCKRTEKMLNVRKERVAQLEKNLSEEKEQKENTSEKQKLLLEEWQLERDTLQLKLAELEGNLSTISSQETSWKEKSAYLEGKVLTLESQLSAKHAHIKQLEESMSSQSPNSGVSQVELSQVKEHLETVRREVVLKEQELSAMRQDQRTTHTELVRAQDELGTARQDLLKLQQEKRDLDSKAKSQAKENKELQSKVSELDVDYQAERQRLERMKVIHDKDLKNKEIELATLKGKLRTLEQTSGAGSKKIEDLKKEYEMKFKQMESNLAAEKKEYDDLTAKYEILEEEHVVTKAKLTIEKETAQGEVLQLQKEISNSSVEFKNLQDTYNAKTDAWIKEQIDYQDKLSSLEERLCGGGWEVEKARLLNRLQEKEKELDHITKERDVSNHLQDALKREVEEVRKKLDDYDKVTKVHRNLTMDNSNMEQEIKALQNRLAQADKAKKTEVADCKLRYEAQMQSIQEEMQSVQTQVSRFKRERDMYKQMLDGAHKTMSEMRANNGDAANRNSNRSSTSSMEELEESKSRVASLQQQVACLEDGLCEARMEASRARTELVSERSTAEIRLSEMQSKLNEFEEERLVASGRTKIPGLRTRLELAWQKEREDQQRLLQETSTLARDLRQTLFEVERERDKEKLDMKRRIDQLKKSAEEETDDNKKKVTELQCDLLELRDAHAKLRTTNEKLRREKERHDRDREQHKMSMAALKRSQQDEDRKISYLLELVDELTKMTPDDLTRAQDPSSTLSYLTPTPPRRNRSSKSRSREATPEESFSDSGPLNPLSRLKMASQDVRAVIQSDRQRRQANMRRAASTEPRDTIVTTVTPRASNGRTPSLKKRSISLEQTNNDQGKIWKTDDDSMSSLQSLDTEALDSNRHYTMQRDTSLDSRLSGGSTQSDVLPAGDKKKKKGIFGKLKRLTKSRSIDDTAGPEVVDVYTPMGSQGGSDSDMSNAGSKRDLRGRISDMFSRKGGAGSSSSSVGKERRKELMTPVASRSDSLQRPLSRNGSSNQIARASPASDIVSPPVRSVSMTPGLQRKAK